jgi:hypothetical protein
VYRPDFCFFLFDRLNKKAPKTTYIKPAKLGRPFIVWIISPRVDKIPITKIIIPVILMGF